MQVIEATALRPSYNSVTEAAHVVCDVYSELNSYKLSCFGTEVKGGKFEYITASKTLRTSSPELVEKITKVFQERGIPIERIETNVSTFGSNCSEKA